MAVDNPSKYHKGLPMLEGLEVDRSTVFGGNPDTAVAGA